MVRLHKKGAHFSRIKFRAILRYFSADINVTIIAKFVHLNRDIVNKIFLEIRQIIAKHCKENSIFKVGEIELDESYFGAKRIRSNAIVFFSPHSGKVYDRLVDYGYKKHCRVIHSNNEFANGKNHINGTMKFLRFMQSSLS